jgi:hypothetical protein
MATATDVDNDRAIEARIRTLLDSLVHQRQELRRGGGDEAALEANRLAIVYWQQALTAHLGMRGSPPR